MSDTSNPSVPAKDKLPDSGSELLAIALRDVRSLDHLRTPLDLNQVKRIVIEANQY